MDLLQGEETMKSLCSYFKITRQAFYKSINSEEHNRLKESLVVKLVQEKRRYLPRIGGRKLYYLLKDDLLKIGKIGRDKFFRILAKNDLLVKRKKSYTRTTNSFHRFYKWSNLIKDLSITRPNQVWVSDITYIRTLSGFVYLFLITDLYSRKIVGWSLSRSLSIEGGLEALQMALRSRKDKSLSLIHHSDRGVQYCSKEYVKMLQGANIGISMTEENHCYENAVAERVNGILKNEFYLDATFNNFKQALSAVISGIMIYNEKRPHWSLNLQTPSQVHSQTKVA
ncbi:MAG TPA: IS3 family transposase [Bacteroidales bacterium]|nr:IS3 family transposase [Bacteroidales bacterium]